MKKNVSAAGKNIRKKAIHAPAVLNEPVQYDRPVSFSRGMRIELGAFSLILISGTASVNEQGKSVHAGDILAQSRRTFNNIAALLESEGASWKDVVRTTCYLKDMRDYGAFNKIRNQFYVKQKLNPFPASTCIEAGLCRPELLVEIEVIAIIGRADK